MDPIFTSIALSLRITYLTAIVGKMNVKIDKLMQTPLDSAMRSLQAAAESISETKELLRDARSHFNEAISLEKNERLLVAYLGLAVCHYSLDDKKIAKKILNDVRTVTYTGFIGKTIKAAAHDAVEYNLIMLGVRLCLSPYKIAPLPTNNNVCEEIKKRKDFEEKRNLIANLRIE